MKEYVQVCKCDYCKKVFVGYHQTTICAGCFMVGKHLDPNRFDLPTGKLELVKEHNEESK